MIKNKDVLGSIDTIPYFFRHYYLQNFALYVNGKQNPGGGGGLSMDTSHQKKSCSHTERFLKDRAFITRTRDFR